MMKRREFIQMAASGALTPGLDPIADASAPNAKGQESRSPRPRRFGRTSGVT